MRKLKGIIIKSLKKPEKPVAKYNVTGYRKYKDEKNL